MQYTLAESPSPVQGYTASGWVCKDGDAVVPVTGGNKVTVPKGTSAVCTITNTRDMGPFVITKVFDAKASGFDGDFTIDYQCADGVTGSVDLAGSVAGQSSDVVTVPTGDCTITEQSPAGAPQGWTFGTPSYDPATVTVVVGDTPAEAKVTNTISRDMGPFVITKVFDAKASGFDGDFTIDYQCADGVTGSVDLAGSVAGQSSDVVTVPTGDCTITEQSPAGAPQGWTFGTPSYDPATVTVVVGDTPAEAKVTNTISRDMGPFVITKVFDAKASGFDGDFTIDYQCADGVTGSVDLAGSVAGQSSDVVTVPTGDCTITEQSPAGAPQGWTFGTPSYDPATVTVVVGDTPAEAKVTNTISRDMGPFVITKVFDAKASGFDGDFTIDYQCADGVTGSVDLAGSVAGQSSDVVTVPTGDCTITEQSPAGAPQGWTFGTPSYDPATVTVVVGDTPAEAKVTNTISLNSNEVTLEKVWVDGFAGDEADLQIEGGFISPAQNTSTAPEVPVPGNSATTDASFGATVSVSEDLVGNTGSYDVELLCVDSQDVEVSDSADGTFTMPDAPVTCTYTNTRTQNGIVLRKVWVDGFAGDTADLQITGGLTSPAENTSTSPDAPVPGNSAVDLVLSGETVVVSEDLVGNTGSYDVELLCVDSQDVEVSDSADGTFTMPDAPVTCTYTNTRDTAQLTLQKAWVNARGGDTAALSIDGGVAGEPTATSVAAGALGTVLDLTNRATASVLVGDPVTVAEALGASNAGTYGSTLVCDNDVVPAEDGTFTMPNAAVTCTFTNDRTTIVPTEATVTAAACLPDGSGTTDGSITIPENPDYDYFIEGVAYAAGTHPFAPGTYAVTAQMKVTAPVAATGFTLNSLAVQDLYTWTVVVPGSPACPILDKSSDPPSGETVQTGDTVTYTVTVQNSGDTAVSGETLVDTLPDGVELIESTIDPSTGVYDAAAGTITWTFDLAAAAGDVPSTATFTYQVEVTTDEGSITNLVSWVERDLTDNTTHPVEPGTVGGTETENPPVGGTETENPPVGGTETGLASTGAGDTASVAAAGVVAMLFGGLMVGFGRRRRRMQG